MNSTLKHKRQSRINGRKGGRPPGITLEMTGDLDNLEDYVIWRRNGIRIEAEAVEILKLGADGARVRADGVEYFAATLPGYPATGRYYLAPPPKVKARPEAKARPMDLLTERLIALRTMGRDHEADLILEAARDHPNKGHHMYKRLTAGQVVPEITPLEIVTKGGRETVRESERLKGFTIPGEPVKLPGGAIQPGFGHDREVFELILEKWERRYKSDKDRHTFVGGLHYYLRRTHYGPPYPPVFFSSLAAELVKRGRGPE